MPCLAVESFNRDPTAASSIPRPSWRGGEGRGEPQDCAWQFHISLQRVSAGITQADFRVQGTGPTSTLAVARRAGTGTLPAASLVAPRGSIAASTTPSTPMLPTTSTWISWYTVLFLYYVIPWFAVQLIHCTNNALRKEINCMSKSSHEIMSVEVATTKAVV